MFVLAAAAAVAATEAVSISEEEKEEKEEKGFSADRRLGQRLERLQRR